MTSLDTQLEATAARLGISREELAHRYGARTRPKREKKPPQLRVLVYKDAF
jgi:hypothetical protein